MLMSNSHHLSSNSALTADGQDLVRMILAGFFPATVQGGTPIVTVEPATTTVPLPTIIPLVNQEEREIYTSFPTTMSSFERRYPVSPFFWETKGTNHCGCDQREGRCPVRSINPLR